MNRPILLIDVDGVISLFGFDHGARPDGRFLLVDGITHFLSGTAGGHLRRLEPAFELAWCTGWEEKANDYLPLALGLDGPLAHVVFDPEGAAARRALEAGRHRPACRFVQTRGVDRRCPRRPLPVVGRRASRADAARDHRPGGRDHRAGGRSAAGLGRRPRERGYALADTDNTGGRRSRPRTSARRRRPTQIPSPRSPRNRVRARARTGPVEGLAQDREISVFGGSPSPRAAQVTRRRASHTRGPARRA